MCLRLGDDMADQSLKYGTLVIAGLAVIGGFYYESTQRVQVYAKDYIEVIEGVRERQAIATAIDGTNRVALQIATNQYEIAKLDTVITNLAHYFVNQDLISSWASSSTDAPPCWTAADLYQTLSITNDSGYGFHPYSLQTTKRDLDQRFRFLQKLKYTYSVSRWGSNITYASSYSTNFGTADVSEGVRYGGPANYNQCSNAESFFNSEVLGAHEPTNWTNVVSANAAVYVDLTNATTTYSFSTNYPRFSWLGAIYAKLFQVYAGAQWYGTYWDNGYGNFNRIDGTNSTTKIDANLYAVGRAVPIARVDSFYLYNYLFYTSSIPENTVTSWSCYYVIDDGVCTGLLSFSTNFTLPESNTYVSCSGSFLDSVSRQSPSNSWNPTNFYGTNITAYIDPRYTIHAWAVERCVE